MANSWFRAYAEFATDAKVQSMSEALQRRLFMLMCLRCSNSIETLQDDELAFALHITESDLAETKAVFVRKRFIDDAWNLLNWDKRQFASDSSADRVRKHREAKQQLAACNGGGNVTETACNVSATPPDTDTDTEEAKDIGIDEAYPSRSANGVSHKSEVESVEQSESVDLPDSPEPRKRRKREGIPSPGRKLADLWDEVLPEAQSPAYWTKQRGVVIGARWEQMAEAEGWKTQEEGMQWFRDLFLTCRRSRFLMGKIPPRKPGDRPFSLKFDWLFGRDNFTKVIEGEYLR